MKPNNFDRTPLVPERLRRIDGSFAFIPHRFLREGYWASLEHDEILLFLLLSLVADRQGMSFYHDDRLSSILRFVLDRFICARTGLLQKDLLAYNPHGSRYQLLSLPVNPVLPITPQTSTTETPLSGSPSPCGQPKHIRVLIRQFLSSMESDDP